MARSIISHFFTVAVLVPLVAISCQAFPVVDSIKTGEGQTNETIGNEELWNYLKSFGYINSTGSYDGEVCESALKIYQQVYNLNVTGKLDSETMKLMTTPRCGVSDGGLIDGGGGSRSRRAQVGDHFQLLFEIGPSEWPHTKFHLKWKINGGDGDQSNVGNIALQQACFYAFNLWAKVSPFTFQFVGATVQADLLISFQVNKPYFGGPSVLGISNYPTGGRMRLNADVRTWSFRPPKNKEFDLFWVCIHEIGHLLGIAHSSDPKAIMYAYVTPGETRRALHPDDIAAIHAMYPR